MPNFVTAGFCTDISSAGFRLTVEALCLPPAQVLSFQPSPMISRTSQKGRKSPVLLCKGLPPPEFYSLNLIPHGFSDSLKYLFVCFNLSCFSDCFWWNSCGVLKISLFLRSKSPQNVFLNSLEVEF